ncbi:hypothetical protein A2U01_0110522, partial [Trifolium medium]|nr:hypothetical protein [Trifolium medium]
SPTNNVEEQQQADNAGDPRDDRETSLSSDDGGDDIQILTERQKEKRPQST